VKNRAVSPSIAASHLSSLLCTYFDIIEKSEANSGGESQTGVCLLVGEAVSIHSKWLFSVFGLFRLIKTVERQEIQHLNNRNQVKNTRL